MCKKVIALDACNINKFNNYITAAIFATVTCKRKLPQIKVPEH